jgi:aspartate carbamoyltransferase catalytic subunit
VRHLLSISDLGRDGIEEVLTLTDSFVEVSERRIPKVPTLRGKTVVSLFYEDSTRTRLSFESAAKRLSADTMNFSVGTSSVKKGESLRDTVLTIEAMGVDAIVVRHASSGVPWQVAQWVDAAVVNAGDGWPVSVSYDLDAVLPKCDVVYLLRMQRERMTEALIPSLREYTASYGLTRRRVDLLDERTLVMHPGPMNRGVEIAAEVAELPRSVITRQVANGVAVRMAVLFLLLGSGAELVAA